MIITTLYFPLCFAMVVHGSLAGGHANHRHDTSPDVDLVPAVRIRPPETTPGWNIRHSRGHSMHFHPTTDHYHRNSDEYYDYYYSLTDPDYSETETEAGISTESGDYEISTEMHKEQATTEQNDRKDPFDANNEKYQNSGTVARLSNFLWVLPTLISVAVLI